MEYAETSCRRQSVRRAQNKLCCGLLNVNSLLSHICFLIYLVKHWTAKLSTGLSALNRLHLSSAHSFALVWLSTKNTAKSKQLAIVDTFSPSPWILLQAEAMTAGIKSCSSPCWLIKLWINRNCQLDDQ